MPTVDVINQEKKKVGTIDLRDDVFAGIVNIPLVHQVIKAQLAGRRQGTAKTKVKSEVRGGGRKPFRQKGTGNARQGSTRSPLNPGGGQSFGPQPRNYEQATPKEMIRGALRSALADRFKADRLLVINEFKLPEIKTKAMAAIKSKLEVDKALIVDDQNTNLEMSTRNLPHVKILRTEGLNVYDIIAHEWILITERAVAKIHTRLAKGEASAAKTKTKRAPAAKKAASKKTAKAAG